VNAELSGGFFVLVLLLDRFVKYLCNQGG